MTQKSLKGRGGAGYIPRPLYETLLTEVDHSYMYIVVTDTELLTSALSDFVQFKRKDDVFGVLAKLTDKALSPAEGAGLDMLHGIHQHHPQMLHLDSSLDLNIGNNSYISNSGTSLTLAVTLITLNCSILPQQSPQGSTKLDQWSKEHSLQMLGSG